MKTALKMIRLNLDDLGAAAAIVGGVFLLMEVVIAVVMSVMRAGAETTIALGWIVLPVVAGFLCLFFNSMQVTVGFDLLLRYGVTRRDSILAVTAHMLTMTCFSFGLAFVLGEADRLIARFWMNTMHLREVEMADGHIPLPVYLLIILGLVILGLGGGALLQRFGRKGFWVLWGIWMVVMLGQSAIIDAIDSITNAAGDASFQTVVSLAAPIAVLAAVVIAALSVWSLMRATVKN